MTTSPGAEAGPVLPLGTWVLLNVGKREFPASKAGLAVDWEDRVLFFQLPLLDTAPHRMEPEALPSSVQSQGPDF